jgi:signal transduction histidine kinase
MIRGAGPGDQAAVEHRYGKEGYFFGYDSNTVRLFKANSPEGVGQSFKDNRDPNGVYVNRDLVKVAKDGTHYLQYSSPLPSNNQVLVPKLGYTEYLSKWDMAVGTSVNLDGIEAQVAVVEAKVQEAHGRCAAEHRRRGRGGAAGDRRRRACCWPTPFCVR